MAPRNEFLAFATGAGAQVLSPTDYAAMPARVKGFVEGPADEFQVNTVWRQSSEISAIIGQFIVDLANVDALDNGDTTTLLANFKAAINAAAASQIPSIGGTAYVHAGVDTSNVGSSIIADVSPDIAAYGVGNVFVIRAANTATGATTANIDDKGTINILRSDKTPTQKGDWAAGEMLILISDGNNLLLYGVKTSNQPARNLSSFSSAGSYNFTVPAGIFWLYVEIVGGGGGGAGGGPNTTWASAGGGSGGYSAGWISVSPGQVIPLVVGVRGLGADASNGATGGTGGTTTFGTFLQATGGQGGKGSNSDAGGGAPGTGSGGQKNFPGGAGGDGSPLSANNSPGGNGAASAFGGGGRTSTFNRVLSNGIAPGSGGGGIWSNSSSTNQLGGNGADGAVFIQY